ncbi:MAG: hypothetical protein EXS17_06690 [Phycisphaerales bacterium]|nr:hypothetical protein [Phycisphaerales bacterium]
MSNSWTLWGKFASKLGTSPKQLALLTASALAAVGIFGGKLLIEPKSAAATAPMAAPTTKVASEAAVVIPETLFHTAPRWNLASIAARSPFMSPADLQPKLDVTLPTGETAVARVACDLVLQATLDRSLAIVSGKTLRVGQQWTDPQTKKTFQLLEVGERTARFSSGGHFIELSLRH